MGTTTIPVNDAVKSRLEHYRYEDHDSWDDVLLGMMEMLPERQVIEDEGCVNCNSELFFDTLEESGGVINFYRFEDRGQEYVCSNYFCSEECFVEFQEELDEKMPSRPDRVYVGGRKFERSVFRDSHLVVDGRNYELTVDIPMAFESANDSYEGEPVYIWNAGKYRVSGVVIGITHGTGSTTLIFTTDFAVTEQLHPDEEKRDSSVTYFESEETDYEKNTCSVKGTPVYVGSNRELCPLCGSKECDVSE